MNFKLVSSILRSNWLLDKQWAERHMPIVVAALTGEGSFAGLSGDDDYDEGRDKSAAILHYQTNAGSVYRVNSYTNLTSLPDGSIAMINLTGAVTKHGGMCSYGMVDHTATVNRISNSPNIKGLILNIDSPGGEASGTSMLADAIKAASANKPVIAVIDDGMAASAAMWIASAANEIYVTKRTDMVGSIGVYTTIADWAGYYESKGLKVKEIYAPQSTDKNQNYYQALEGNEEPLKEELQVLAQEFIDTVARNRAGKIKGDSWKSGKMFYGKDAQKIGLIDGIKSFDQVIVRMDKMIRDKQNSNSNNMAFEKTLAAAGAAAFEVVDGGFMLTEDNLTAVETALCTAATNAGLLETATATVQEQSATIETLTAAAATKDQRIAALEAIVAEYGGKSSGSGSSVAVINDVREEDTETEKRVYKLSDPEHPQNKIFEASKKYQGFK